MARYPSTDLPRPASNPVRTAGERFQIQPCQVTPILNADFQRIKRLPPYVFNIIGELKQQARAAGEDIIDFGMGNPDQPTPSHIVDKLIETARRGDTHGYSQSKGIPRLRKAICDWYQRRFDVTLDPASEAIVTLGSKEGLAHLALATTGPGDAILVPNPSYPIHPYGFVISGADIRHVPMGDNEDDFFAELEKAYNQLAAPQDAGAELSFQPHGTVRGAGFLQASDRRGPRAFHLGDSGSGLR
jgi:DNA-binding transcriptional MocR family regulator